VRPLYVTVRRRATAELEERRSRFIANVSPVEDEAAALSFVDEIRREYADATHNVYAYRVGVKVPTQKSSDAGEPAGTAGMPVLEAIRRSDLTNVVVVVSRYFGGILLGAGGLARTYSRAALQGLRAAEPVRMVRHIHLRLELDYSLYGKIEHLVASRSLRVLDKSFARAVSLVLAVPAPEEDGVRRELARLSGGTVSMAVVGSSFLPVARLKL